MASKAQELREHYGIEQAKILNEVAGLSTKIAEVDTSALLQMSDATRNALGQDAGQVEAAARSVAWTEERNRLKEKYIELELELRAAIEIAAEEAEKELSPQDATFHDLATAASATPEALIQAMDMALSMGLGDAAKLAFKAGRDRDLDDVVAHGLDHGPEEWSGLYVDIQEAGGQPELDPGDRFEAIAGRYPAGSKYEILQQRASNVNVLGRMF